MAISIDFTNVLTGANYASGYAKLSEYKGAQDSVMLTFDVFHDQACCDDGKSAVAQVGRVVIGDDFTTYFSETELKKLDKTILSQADQYAVDKIDEFLSGTIV